MLHKEILSCNYLCNSHDSRALGVALDVLHAATDFEQLIVKLVL